MGKFIKIGRWISYISACIGLCASISITILHKSIIESIGKLEINILYIIIGSLPIIITMLFALPNTINHKKLIHKYDEYYKNTNFLYLFLCNLITTYISLICIGIFNTHFIWVIIAILILSFLNAEEIIMLSYVSK